MRKWVFGCVAAAVMALVIGAATEAVTAQQAGNDRAMLYHGLLGAPVDCAGNGADSGAPGGFLNVHVNLRRGKTALILHARGLLPATEYRSHLRCIGLLGTFWTDGDGNADVTFNLPGPLTGTFAVDGHSLPLNDDADVFVSEPIRVR